MTDINIIEARTEVEKIRKEASDNLARLQLLESQIKQSEKDISVAADSIDKLGDTIHKDMFLKFFEKPYVVIPQRKNKILVVVPKFIKGFQVGWLWKETESFLVYELDQYSAWLGDVPRELLEEVGVKKEFTAEIVGNQIMFSPEFKAIIKKKLDDHLRDYAETSARITRGHEFDVIAGMIENGCLPFKPLPVQDKDLQIGKAKFTLRDYQKPAYNEFLKTGAIGLFHPTGSGKSMIAMKAIDSLKGRKLIIVPSKTLIEQWNYYIDTFIPHEKSNIELSTYQGYRVSEESDYILVIYDECQRLPADVFSRLSLIKTKYRIGLSASPHREDGRESYIFALTGFPVGLNWQAYMKEVGRKYHPVYVHIVRSSKHKLREVKKLIDMNKKTLIFCDSIDLGKRVSAELQIPHVYADTDNRLEVVNQNNVCVISRVGDLGMSVKDLKQVIEIDFLFGSRQQELQRTGRLMHSLSSDVRHDIIMTRDEFEKYGKRLWSLQEKGFVIKLIESERRRRR